MVKKIPDIDKVFKVVPKGPAEKPAVKEKTGSAKARKTAARLAAVQVLYQMHLNNQDAQSALREFFSHRSGFNLDGDVLVPPDRDLLNAIVNGVVSRWEDVQGVIDSALGREVEPLLEAVLRCGVFELLSHADIDTPIIISDYLSVTVGFYDGTETKLVNGVLDKVAKTVRG